jgi:hypothetical protein
MNRHRILLGFGAALTLLSSAWAGPGADDWKYDLVYLKNGGQLRGMVIEQNPQHIVIRCISRKPGSPTVVSTQYLAGDEVERTELLGPEERDKLHKRLIALKNEREALAAHLKLLDPGVHPDNSFDSASLKPGPWPPDPKSKALVYASTHFQLISNAREEMVQLAAIQLEQVYAAYARCLPPQVRSAQPTTILLVRSLGEYQELLRERGHSFFNPAFYDVTRNQVVCGSDLQRLSDELERSLEQHQRLAAEMEERRAELVEVYKGKVPAELLAPMTQAQKRIKWTDERNREAFRLARQRLFQRLYHEAFHAYLAAFVYPPGEFDVPVWLNEGLAQIFETAIVEVGELRVGHADEERLQAVRQALKTDTLMPLADLLKSTAKDFQVAHATSRQLSDRYYLASWALAHHLTFGRKVLGSKAMNEYVRALKHGTDPLLAFRDLVGQPLDQFEKSHHQFLIALRPEGLPH